jgi:hypothetical protein
MQMNKFLVIFSCAENSEKHEAWKQLSISEQQERMARGMDAQSKWSTKYKDRILYEGSALGETKKVSESGISCISSKMGMFMVVTAQSHEEAAKLFLDHPHFTIFPGDAIEVVAIVQS